MHISSVKHVLLLVVNLHHVLSDGAAFNKLHNITFKIIGDSSAINRAALVSLLRPELQQSCLLSRPCEWRLCHQWSDAACVEMLIKPGCVCSSASSWCSSTVPDRGGGWTVASGGSSSLSSSASVRPRRRRLLWRNQRWWRLTWETWSSCRRWLDPWSACTTARPSTRLKSR